MKARIRPNTKLTKKEQMLIRQAVSDQLDKEREGTMRKFFKLLAVSLHQPLTDKSHGMGRVQILRVINKMDELAQECEHDEEYWYHIDKIVIDELKLPSFRRETDYLEG